MKLVMRGASATKEEKKAMREEDTEPSTLDRELSVFLESGAVVDVYRERLEREGVVGRVIQWSEHVLLMDRLDEQYLYDGLSAIRPRDITRIRAGDRELRSVAKLIAHERVAQFEAVALLEISSALTKLSQRYSVVTVYTEGVDSGVAFVGEPEDLDDDFLVLRAWGTARTGDDYRLILRLPEITRVDADTSYIRRLRDVRKAQG